MNIEKRLLPMFFSRTPPTKKPNIPEPLNEEIMLPLLFFCSSETLEIIY